MPEENYEDYERETAAETKVRADVSSEALRRGGWIRIAGPLAALAVGVISASLYVKPIATLRFLQTTHLGWSGVTQTQVALDEGLMTYFMTGGYQDQPPVIMIHGLGPNAALEWRAAMSPVAEGHFKVLAPNLMGFADSEHRQVTHSIGYEAGAIGHFIDALKLDKVNLIGQDLGADVALYYAVDHPDKVERLILVSGGLVGTKGANLLRNALLPTSPDAIRKQCDMAFFMLPPMPDFFYQRMMASLSADLAAQTEMLDSVPKDEGHIRGNLGQIFNTLTIILWGGNDPLYLPADGQALHAALPGSATVTFKTAGPLPQLNNPTDFGETVIYILKQVEGGR